MLSSLNPMLIFIIFLSIQFSAFSQLSQNQTTTITTIAAILTNNSQSVPWNMSRNPCSWPGVSCSSDNTSITSLSLSGFGLSTPEFIPHVCKIESLRSLNASNNRLTAIPDGFFKDCAGLKALNFSKNMLAGSFPPVNALTGLESLDLSFNSLNGSLPKRFGSSGLEEIDLSRNFFHGEIPNEIGEFKNLRSVDFSLNNLSGSIPDGIGNLTKLEVLILSSNNMSGTIPSAISGIQTLNRFAAHQNRFEGTIPEGLTRFLMSLDLSYNNLTGSIPDDLLSNPGLTSVDLSFNSLQGSIPVNMSKSLFRLRLGSNKLIGRIPESFGSLHELTYLELDHNSLSGAIPNELGSCRKLALLDLSHNELTGWLPGSIGELVELQVLNLQNNRFVGRIPDGIQQLRSLFKLNMSWNSFEGSIPNSVVNLSQLGHLALQGNNLSGNIPMDISKLENLIDLQLGQNQLVGEIPDMPVRLQIGLNLSSNDLHGEIPSSLARLTELEVLDLSNNRLSGKIPDSLVGLGSLINLTLSNNQLSGTIPSFRSFVTVNTTGNDQLVPTPKPDSQPSPETKSSSATTKAAILAATLSAVISVSIIVTILLLLSRRAPRIQSEPASESAAAAAADFDCNKQQQHSLLTSSSVHSTNLDFFKAMDAVSDPRNIVARTRFCTYYNATMPSGASYLVKKLNLSEKIFNHRSKFSQECGVLGKLSHSNVMTPLAYAMTEESAYLFYENASLGCLFDVLHHGGLQERSVLDWPCRYSVAVGVAQGLASLHGFRYGPILLLDMSSKNVFLKSMKEPVVGDIELCKVIDPSKSTGSISTVAGSVGYIPPEYAYTMRVTMAGNVYSFGVILLELVTGKPAVSGGIELAKWAVSKSKNQEKWDEIIDSNICSSRGAGGSVAVRSQMLAVLKVALSCVSVSPDSRPKIKSVLRMILNAR
ncbi:Leucine-rich repeat receptor-like tyrosine-protein kinase PXC3 [Linum perenne]